MNGHFTHKFSIQFEHLLEVNQQMMQYICVCVCVCVRACVCMCVHALWVFCPIVGHSPKIVGLMAERLFAYIHAPVSTRIQTHNILLIYVHAQTHVYICMHACTHVHTDTRMHTDDICTQIQVHVLPKHTYVHTCVCTYVYTYLCTCIYTCIHACVQRPM